MNLKIGREDRLLLSWWWGPRNSYSHFTMDDKRRELKLFLETGYGVYWKAGQYFLIST